MKATHILIVNGPNLNLTGVREPEHYGTQPADAITALINSYAERRPGLAITHFQSNHEGAVIDRIQQAQGDGTSGIVINPGGFTHTSVAITDAIRATGLPVVEVHLSHVYAREEFRRHNLIAPACVGSISGLGPEGYLLALEFLTGKIAG